MRPFILLLILLIALITPSIVKAQEQAIPIIAVFKDKPDVNLFQQYGGQVIRVFKIIPGIHGLMKPSDVINLSKDPRIKYVELDEKLNVLEEIQWNLYQIHAPEAWSIGGTYGHHPKIQVAVLDTGVDCTHPDLAANIAWTPSADPGFPSACPDTNGHGTHVTGIVAALLNGFGVAGVAPQVTVYDILVCPGGSCPISDIVQGIQLAMEGPDGIIGTDDDAEVMNMSFGGPGNYPAMQDAIQNAYDHGVVSVAAAGNSGCPDGDTVLEPARYPTVIAMAATTSAKTIADFSSCGPSVTAAAPGSAVLSTLPGGTYGTASGTSMAAPHGTGVVALMQAVRAIANVPLLKPSEVKTIICNTAEDLPPAGFDIRSGCGLLRADRAVQAAMAALTTVKITQTLPPKIVVNTVNQSLIVTNTQTIMVQEQAFQNNTITLTKIIPSGKIIFSSTEEKLVLFDWASMFLAFIAVLLLGSVVGTFVSRRS